MLATTTYKAWAHDTLFMNNHEKWTNNETATKHELCLESDLSWFMNILRKTFGRPLFVMFCKTQFFYEKVIFSLFANSDKYCVAGFTCEQTAYNQKDTP